MGRNKKKTSQRDAVGVQRTNAENKQEQPTNRPKNFLVKDATVPFDFLFYKFGSRVRIRVQQTPVEELWPGGALWDLGVLLAKVLVLLTRNASLDNPCNKTKTTTSRSNIPPRVLSAIPNGAISWKKTCVLELGCGVGLTGLVAAALGARRVLLTDLNDVIYGITQPNVELNHAIVSKVVGCITAMPLCWGNGPDETAVAAALAADRTANRKTRAKKKNNQDENKDTPPKPDMVLIGDVAYQHKPGAPSHFDALLATLLKFVSKDTLVIFGTRMRMPASADLLDMFLGHFSEQVVPPLEAHEIDESFRKNLGDKKHNMTIHFLKLKQQ